MTGRTCTEARGLSELQVRFESNLAAMLLALDRLELCRGQRKVCQLSVTAYLAQGSPAGEADDIALLAS